MRGGGGRGYWLDGVFWCVREWGGNEWVLGCIRIRVGVSM